MAITWKLLIDVNDDGDFVDVADDYSDALQEAEWFLGFDPPESPVAGLSWAKMRVGRIVDEVLGSNLVSNGGFDSGAGWVLGAGYSISGGVLHCAGVSGTTATSPVDAVEFGAPYWAVFTIKNYVSGICRVIAGNSGSGVFVSGNGVHKQRVNGGTNDKVHVQGFSSLHADVDDVELYKIVELVDLVNHNFIIQSVDSVPTTRTHFSGFLSEIRIADDGKSYELRGVGTEFPVYTQQVSIPLFEDVQAGALVQSVVDECVFRSKNIGTNFILDSATQGVLVAAAPGWGLAGLDPDVDLDTGQSTWPYVGDLWDEVLGAAIIADIASSEQGRFFTDRLGVLTFWDRSTINENRGAPDDLTALIIDQEYEITGGKFNSVSVAAQGRVLGTPGTVLWESVEDIIIGSGKTITMQVRFRDSVGLLTGGRDVVELVAGTDYLAEGPSGGDQTDRLVVRLVEIAGTGATLVLHHPLFTDLTVTTLQIRGTPLSVGRPFDVQYTEHARSTFHGVRPFAVNAPLVGTVAEADGIARIITRRYRFGTTQGRWLELNSYDTLLALSLTVFDRVQFDDDYSPSGAQLVVNLVVSEHHKLDQGNHVVRLGLDVDAAAVFLLGDNLDSGKVLGL